MLPVVAPRPVLTPLLSPTPAAQSLAIKSKEWHNLKAEKEFRECEALVDASSSLAQLAVKYAHVEDPIRTLREQIERVQQLTSRDNQHVAANQSTAETTGMLEGACSREVAALDREHARLTTECQMVRKKLSGSALDIGRAAEEYGKGRPAMQSDLDEEAAMKAEVRRMKAEGALMEDQLRHLNRNVEKLALKEQEECLNSELETALAEIEVLRHSSSYFRDLKVYQSEMLHSERMKRKQAVTMLEEHRDETTDNTEENVKAIQAIDFLTDAANRRLRALKWSVAAAQEKVSMLQGRLQKLQVDSTMQAVFGASTAKIRHHGIKGIMVGSAKKTSFAGMVRDLETQGELLEAHRTEEAELDDKVVPVAKNMSETTMRGVRAREDDMQECQYSWMRFLKVSQRVYDDLYSTNR
jgi:hypothetical protein